MDVCPECGRGSGAQEAATRRMIESMGELSPERQMQAEMLIGMAAAVDADPDRGALWREFRIALTTFRNEGAGQEDAFAQLQQALGA